MNVKYLRNSSKIINYGLNYFSITAKRCLVGASLIQNVRNYEIRIHPATMRLRVNASFNANFNFVRFKYEKVIKKDIKNGMGKLNCWNCGLTFDKLDLTCPKCESVIDNKLLKSYNYFELLEEEYKFDFDKTSLVKRLRNAQTKLHPDKTVQKSEVRYYKK